MQDPLFTDLPVKRSITYGTSDDDFFALCSLANFLSEASIGFLNRDEEPITISTEPNVNIDNSEDFEDMNDTSDSSYYTDEDSDTTDTETESEGGFDTDGSDGDEFNPLFMDFVDMPVLTSEEVLEIYESMQCSESEGDDLVRFISFVAQF